MKRIHFHVIMLCALCLAFFTACGGGESDNEDNEDVNEAVYAPELIITPATAASGVETRVTVITNPSGYTFVGSEIISCIMTEPSGTAMVSFFINGLMASGSYCEIMMTYSKAGQTFTIPVIIEIE